MTTNTRTKVKTMEMKKRWKPMLSIGGLLIVLMMTAASVCAEDPLARDNPVPDVPASDVDETSGDEPMLIAPLENETSSSGDSVISPGPEGSSQATASLDIPLVGIIVAGVVIAVALVAIAVRRRK
jgi:hypothetical protein